MSKFDISLFAELVTRGQGPVQALGTAYGMPSCLLNLTAEALALLPSPILNNIRGQTANGANRADDVLKAISAKLRFATGLIEYDTETGTFRFVSDSSKSGMDKNEGGWLSDLGGFLGGLTAAIGFGGRMYQNYQSTVAQIEGIKECLQSYKTYLDYTGANAADRRRELADLDPAGYDNYIESQYANEMQEARDSLEFKRDCLNTINKIDTILLDRNKGKCKEPIFTGEYASIISGTNFLLDCPDEELAKKEIFRLAFGPPVTKSGQFIQSVDGLYYDSQTSGIIPALMELESRASSVRPSSEWRLEHDPNLGGRGRQFSLDDFRSYAHSILDPDRVDDSDAMQPYYSADNLLIDLIGQKNRRVYDVSGQINTLQVAGSGAAIISNMRQVMLSEVSHYISKINKRKKQIELAVKMPAIYGGKITYTPGNIPVNDFSYLTGINYKVDLETQRKLVFDKSEVGGVVLPLDVKFTEKIDSSDDFSLSHLLIANIGIGSIVSDSSGVSSYVLAAVDQVVESNLICLYNFLSTEVETTTSSSNYSLHNSSNYGTRINAQLVGNPATIYQKGVGIAYLDGITKHSSVIPTVPSAVGNFAKLPDAPELQDLLYNPKGATIDTWVHTPYLTNIELGYGYDSPTGVSGLYRLILANENVGIQGSTAIADDILNMTSVGGNAAVKGLIVGFTRDRRITQNMPPSNNTSNNDGAQSAFFLAMTQSFNSSSAGFISRSFYDNGNCIYTSSWHNMKVPLSSVQGGKSFSACGNQFIHVAVTFNPIINQVVMYCDGQQMAVSSYGEVFGITEPHRKVLDIPTLKKNNSFEYSTSSMSGVNVPGLKVGPKLDQYFTPWILGGGYTDGYQSGNFMGGGYGGVISGLKGYLGGTKFYAKALLPSEVLSNYLANKEFFKNIDVSIPPIVI